MATDGGALFTMLHALSTQQGEHQGQHTAAIALPAPEHFGTREGVVTRVAS